MNLNWTSLWGNRVPQVPDCALKWGCDGAEARLCSGSLHCPHRGVKLGANQNIHISVLSGI